MTDRSGREHDPARTEAAVRAALTGRLHGELIVPGQGGYDSARLVWNRAKDERPAAIVRCADADDVIRTIEVARSSSAPLAVRGGGHSQAGHGVCDGGIVLDLRRMDGIRVDPAAGLVRAGGGALVSTLLDALSPHGMVTPTGGCPDVGVGGLTLGGGENLLMARYGAVCDNVVSAQVVTADGRVLTASAAEHGDLYWALRGGGGNFGVVTAFEYRAYPLTRVLSGQLYFPLARTRDVLHRYRDLMRKAPDDLQTSGGLMSAPDGPTLFIAFCHCGDEPSGRRLLDAWRAGLRPESDNVEDKPYAAEFTMPSAPSTGTGAFLPDLYDEVIEILAERLPEAPADSMAVWNDYHGAVTRVAPEEGAFPFRHSGFDLFIMAPWNTPGEHERAAGWVAGLRDSLRPFTRGVYVNNLEDEGAERVRAAYGSSYDRLAKIKARYDPGNVFRRNQNIEPRAE
jgi:hypothetical protein